MSRIGAVSWRRRLGNAVHLLFRLLPTCRLDRCCCRGCGALIVDAIVVNHQLIVRLVAIVLLVRRCRIRRGWRWRSRTFDTGPFRRIIWLCRSRATLLFLLLLLLLLLLLRLMLRRCCCGRLLLGSIDGGSVCGNGGGLSLGMGRLRLRYGRHAWSW